MGLVIASDLILSVLSVCVGAPDEPYGRTCVCVCLCVSTAQWNDFRYPQGADTGGHRRRLCLCGHHPYCLGVCGVSEVSEHTHTHMWFTGTLHRHNGFYTVQTVYTVFYMP